MHTTIVIPVGNRNRVNSVSRVAGWKVEWKGRNTDGWDVGHLIESEKNPITEEHLGMRLKWEFDFPFHFFTVSHK